MNALLIEHYTAIQNPLGRWRANVHVLWRRMVWRNFVSSAQTAKRLLDIVLSFVALVLLSPVFLLIAILIKLEDRGPVFFAQTRVGKDGHEFKMYKFRSMCLNAEAKLAELLKSNQHSQGVTFKMKHDPRLTRIGKYLRMFSLDEFPQFYNVLIGNMSMVGPRPPLPREVKLYTLADRRRLVIKPGLTCFWQIGGRSDIDFSGQVKLDVKYIESQSFWVDIKIIIQTVPAVFTGKGAC